MPESPLPTPESPRWDTFWQRRVIDPFIAQLTQGITPEKIALTLAVGSACALFPLLGTTTLLCLIVGIALRLNQPLIQLINAFCSVPHLFVVYGLIRLGDFAFGVHPTHASFKEFVYRAPHAHFSIWALLHQFWGEHEAYFHRFEMAALRALIVWLLLAPVWIAAVYWSSLPALREAARVRGGVLLGERRDSGK